MRVLVLNSGSSSLKSSVVVVGQDQAIATEVVKWGAVAEASERSRIVARAVRDLEKESGGQPFDAVGHRIVHGGVLFVEPVAIDDGVLEKLDGLSEVAPLHNAAAVETIRAARVALPDVPQVACFDTAFHATLSEVARRYPVPEEWRTRWGIRRFGFHGLSVAWSVRKAAEDLGRKPGNVSVVVAHLGSGCSVTAVRHGRSEWTSMGFTPLEGLMMGTRAGSLDPGILLHLLRAGHLTVEELSDQLERGSGLLGASGVSSDMREIRAAADGGDGRAALAVDMFVARAAEGIASALTWVWPEAVVFTGGIGEHDERTRSAIWERLHSFFESGVQAPELLVIAAREDVVIAEGVGNFLRT